MLKAKAKDQGHKRKCSPKKKVFTEIFQAISTKKRFSKNFFSTPQNFNNSKNSAVLEPRQANFRGLEASRPRPRTSKCVLEAKDVLEDSTSVSHSRILTIGLNPLLERVPSYGPTPGHGF